MTPLVVGFCTYNRAKRLPALVASLREQDSPLPFSILAVNNNSRDDTAAVLRNLAKAPGPTLRWVDETEQGIVAARNRALAESLDCEYFVFIDDDELPEPGLLAAAIDALAREGADCAGGAITVDFTEHSRPAWLYDDLLGFLAAVDHGPDAFWITDDSTPIWTSNIAYRMRLFRDDPTLRFDVRYSRIGDGVGGGEDTAMLSTLLGRRARVRYRPDMCVRHAVEPWRLRRSYFLRLHYDSGFRSGRWSTEHFERTVGGVPLFLYRQLLGKTALALGACMRRQRDWLRVAMNASHACGLVCGYRARDRTSNGF